MKNRIEGTLLGADFPGLKSLLMVPIAEGSHRSGWILSCNLEDDKQYGTVEASLLNSVATILGTHMRNIYLYQQHHELMLSFVRSLVSTLDAKDPYTRGHSERVALIARRLGDELHLPEEDLHDIYLSGLLHDIGKIGVDDRILQKPGKLSDDEFRKIQEHPMIGYSILRGLKNLQKILPGVRSHHENYNGKGYPDGLKGEEIPLMARILAVADAYDAMGSDRPYRSGMDVEQVEQIFRRGAGQQWDARIIEAYFAVRDDIPQYLQRLLAPRRQPALSGRQRNRLRSRGHALIPGRHRHGGHRSIESSRTIRYVGRRFAVLPFAHALMNQHSAFPILCCCVAAIGVAGCGDEQPSANGDPPIPYAEPQDAARAPETTASATRVFEGIEFTIPQSWTETKLSGMRSTILQAAFGVPTLDDNLEITFSSVGGGIDQNIQRWIGQFGGAEADQERIQVAGISATWIDIRGAFSAPVSGRPGPHSEWRLLGIAVPRQPQDLYVKTHGTTIGCSRSPRRVPTDGEVGGHRNRSEWPQAPSDSRGATPLLPSTPRSSRRRKNRKRSSEPAVHGSAWHRAPPPPDTAFAPSTTETRWVMRCPTALGRREYPKPSREFHRQSPSLRSPDG